ncbi:hypothetical protein, partial [Chryseobacterium sp. CH1]|uniref:hypothetical protein n=1 Tax=Chryseobacterium sp. CH1 TaxID=713551 RepID=UPI001027C446
IGLTFFSPELLLIDIIDNKYLLSKETDLENGWETFMLPFHPQVAIAYYLEDPSKHKIGLTFFSPELLLIDIIDNKYLLSKETDLENGW